LLSLSSLLLPAVVMWWLRIHLRETERDRQQAVCRHTDVLTLRAGETFVGVIEEVVYQLAAGNSTDPRIRYNGSP
jgi:hypothetical protein